MEIISKSSIMCVDFTIKGEEVCKYSWQFFFTRIPVLRQWHEGAWSIGDNETSRMHATYCVARFRAHVMMTGVTGSKHLTSSMLSTPSYLWPSFHPTASPAGRSVRSPVWSGLFTRIVGRSLAAGRTGAEWDSALELLTWLDHRRTARGR